MSSPRRHSLDTTITDDSDTNTSPHTSAATATASVRARKVKSDAEPSPSGRGRAGCWSCRLRRKKCDEQQIDGQCQTCVRLRIDCLGWGTKRPEWMRDKTAVEAYKNKIKHQLTTQGMIRGQPRTAIGSMQPRPSYSISRNSNNRYTNPTPHLIPQPQYSFVDDEELQSEHFRSTLQNNGIHGLLLSIPSTPNRGFSYPIKPSQPVFSTEPMIHSLSSSPYQPFENLPLQQVYDDPSSTAVVPSPSARSYSTAIDRSPYAPTYQGQTFEYEPRVRHFMPHSSLSAARESHVYYYFRHVRKMQYAFAGADVTTVFHDIIVREPHGPVTNAICGLAALHNSRMRIANGLEDPHSTAMLDRSFYQDSIGQISQSKQRHGVYSDVDATAAVHGISYWLFQGGSGDWEATLNVARDWFLRSPVFTQENPVLAMLELEQTAKFTSRATMWMDIFSSITLLKPPRFLDLYRRLFRGAEGYWQTGLGSFKNQLTMDGLMGCPDEVMLAIAEVANLASWREEQLSRKRLSIRDLVSRGDAIEQELRSQETMRAWFRNASHSNEFEPSFNGDIEPMSSYTGSTAPSSSVSSPASILTSPLPNIPGLPSSHQTDEEMRTLSSNVFRESAFLYLYTVMSGPCPEVPEIKEAVAATIEAVHRLPISEYDRSLVFPICLAGCMTDDPAQREFCRSRFAAQTSAVGNVAEAGRLMQAVWDKRDQEGGTPGWREVMAQLGLNLLLV